jgi:hypothetical protein
MDIQSLHSPIMRRLVEALNAGQDDSFVALFTPDAEVVDGPSYHGLEAIRDWNRRENIGVHMHIDVQEEKNAQGTEITFQASSQGGYSGPGTFTITLHNDHIRRLVIG